MNVYAKTAMIVVLLAVLVIYVACYTVVYSFRGPAGNMLFFVYPEIGLSERNTYLLFYPAYFVHKKVCSIANLPFGKHNQDRAKINYAEMGP